MRIALLVDYPGMRRWQSWLADDLATSGHDLVLLQPSEASRSFPPALQLAIWLDGIYYRQSGEHAFDALVSSDRLASRQAHEAGRFDVLIDLSSGAEPRPAAARVLAVTFNGLRSESGATAVLLSDEPLSLLLEDSAAAGPEQAQPAISRRDCLTEALDSVFSCVVELVAARIPRPRTSADIESPPRFASPARPPPRTAGFGAARAAAGHVHKLVAAKLTRYLTRRAVHPRKWSLALRTCTGAGLVGGRWPAQATYNVVPDDGGRFYADPFLFQQEGRTFVFCEDFPFATGRGVISVGEIDATGRLGELRPVLERPYHLSYPFVFAHGGEIWMVPETSEANRVELYRAVDFPYRWEFDRTLIDGIAACDATIMDHAGACWMFLTATRPHGSTWDKLRIYSAPSRLGPWHELPCGLVKIDSKRARPAGAIVRRGGDLLRPSQDCSRFYGGGMTLSRIEALSAQGCRERPLATVRVTSRDDRTGTHTYSRLGDWEAVDVWGDFLGIPLVGLSCEPLPQPGGVASATSQTSSPAFAGPSAEQAAAP